MKILFFGDYSNLHACLAKPLREEGHEVCVVSDRGGYMQTDADITLRRGSGLTGAARYVAGIATLLPRLRGFDVVQFVNPIALTLRPALNKLVFDRLRSQNRSVFLTLCGNDYYYVKACVESRLLRFSEFRTGNEPTPFARSNPQYERSWLSDAVRRYTEHFYSHVDGAMSVLPEYDIVGRPLLGDKVRFTDIPVDLSALPYEPLEIDGKVRITVAMRPEFKVRKGTALMLDVCRSLEAEMPGEVSVECVGGLSLRDYLDKIRQSHIIVDQLYAYSPATNALQTMALGRVSATGAQPEYYSFINEPTMRPLIALSPFDPDLKATMRRHVLDRDALKRMSAEGRKIVERENDSRIVARRFADHWASTLSRK